MASDHIDEAIHVHDVGLSHREIATATGAALSTVRAWLARRNAPSGERAERLVDLSAVVERLARVIKPNYVAVWLNSPIEVLDNQKPLDRITRGDYRAVARVTSSIEDPGAS
jgi:hypothetical protein